MRRGGLTLAALGLAAALIAGAAAPAGLEDPEATVVPELVVQGVLPGPTWWTVRHGDSTVYILGIPEEPVAKSLTWNQAVLQQRLVGASVLIVPVEPKAGLGDIPAGLKMLSLLKTKTSMELGLPEPLRARFEAARMRLGKPLSRYDNWDPIVAGQILVNDFYENAGATTKQPLDAVKRAAGRAHALVRPAGTYRVMDLFSPIVRNLTPELSKACLSEALDEVDTGQRALDAVGAAWAKGDTKAVLAGPRGFTKCFLLLQGGAAFWRQSIAEEAEAVATTLNRPGHAVAVFPIRSLVAENGVLERLKTRGLEVSAGRD